MDSSSGHRPLTVSELLMLPTTERRENKLVLVSCHHETALLCSQNLSLL